MGPHGFLTFAHPFRNGGGAMRKLGLVGSVVLATSVWLAATVPVFGDDTGVVTATVNVQDVPCITLGTTNINYGQKAFSTSLTFVNAPSSISNIDSCSTSAQTLLGTGSLATGTLASWSPVPTLSCSGPSTNEYRHTLRNLESSADVHLSLSAQSLGTLAGNQQDASVGTMLLMPCTGSDGAGQTMAMQVTLTATVP